MQKMTEKIWEHSNMFAPKGCLYRIFILTPRLKSGDIPFVYVSNGIPTDNFGEVFKIFVNGKTTPKKTKIPEEDINKIKHFVLDIKDLIINRWNGFASSKDIYKARKGYTKQWEDL